MEAKRDTFQVASNEVSRLLSLSPILIGLIGLSICQEKLQVQSLLAQPVLDEFGVFTNLAQRLVPATNLFVLCSQVIFCRPHSRTQLSGPYGAGDIVRGR